MMHVKHKFATRCCHFQCHVCAKANLGLHVDEAYFKNKVIFTFNTLYHRLCVDPVDPPISRQSARGSGFEGGS